MRESFVHAAAIGRTQPLSKHWPPNHCSTWSYGAQSTVAMKAMKAMLVKAMKATKQVEAMKAAKATQATTKKKLSTMQPMAHAPPSNASPMTPARDVLSEEDFSRTHPFETNVLQSAAFLHVYRAKKMLGAPKNTS